ncbi:TPA: hypothetical protein I8627_004059 [Citrobacter freundii]|uniref:hypothetical protein n=1 Tax=Citrobacter freundii TaxID=546 RepID=UPI0011F2D8DD|nr:hypothetical protein [Citrobacter freundii]KAA1148850.1 hypothetical protein D3H39_04655 [Citrobacter portucalensis]EMB4317634.1 hypothetical protein [Citrobacter freundii]MBJ9193742.1 hypothetical protein [Citrobacter freundii]MDS0975563.1 hypothetical protein [Citrobacter portucalensis]HAT3771176.1 hypothetical protein [Citrobacter freundii]
MPATTSVQKAAFDAIDSLHFSQVMMSLICADPVAEEWYGRIFGRINSILQNAGITGKQAQIAKHYLLGALEIYLSIDSNYFSVTVEHNNKGVDGGTPYDRELLEQLVEHNRNCSIAMLCNIADYNGVDREFFFQATEELMNDKELSTIPGFIRFRLTECCYALEYPDAPLRFYRELVNLGIVSCGKYSPRNDQFVKGFDSGFSLSFIRAGLLFEFKILQRALSVITSLNKNGTLILPALDLRMTHTERKNIADYYKRFVDVWLLEDNSRSFAVFQCKDDVSSLNVEILLKNMNRFYFHKRMFGGTQGSWLGTLGAFDIEVSRRIEPERAIYFEGNNSLTISERIRSKFMDSGFSVSARNLYLRHKTVRKNSYSKIRYYYVLLLNQPCIFPWYLNDNSCYDMALEFDDSQDFAG